MVDIKWNASAASDFLHVCQTGRFTNTEGEQLSASFIFYQVVSFEVEVTQENILHFSLE